MSELFIKADPGELIQREMHWKSRDRVAHRDGQTFFINTSPQTSWGLPVWHIGSLHDLWVADLSPHNLHEYTMTLLRRMLDSLPSAAATAIWCVEIDGVRRRMVERMRVIEFLRFGQESKDLARSLVATLHREMDNAVPGWRGWRGGAGALGPSEVDLRGIRDVPRYPQKVEARFVVTRDVPRPGVFRRKLAL